MPEKVSARGLLEKLGLKPRKPEEVQPEISAAAAPESAAAATQATPLATEAPAIESPPVADEVPVAPVPEVSAPLPAVVAEIPAAVEAPALTPVPDAPTALSAVEAPVAPPVELSAPVAPAAEGLQVPVVEEVVEPAVEPEPQPVPLPAVEAAPEAAPEAARVEKPSEENRHPLAVELQQKMQDVYRPFRAARLWRQAESARAGVEKTISKGKIGQLLAEEGELKKQAKELYPGIERMTVAERGELSRKIVPLSAEGATEAIRISSPRHREDMAAFYDTELSKWENVLRDAGDFEQYQAGRAEIESQKNAARQLFPDEGDKRLLDQAIARIEQRGSGRLKELEVQLPRRLLELAGFIPSESATLGQVESDMDLRLAYNRAAQQFFEELTGAREKTMPPMPAPESAPVVEEAAEPAAEVSALSSAEEEAAPASIGAAAEAPEEPVEALAEAAPVAEVMVDKEERARGEAAKPVEVHPGESVEQPAEGVAAEPMEKQPIDVTVPAEEKVKASMQEAPVGTEAAAETPEQRFERRKQGFAEGLAELDKVRGDTNGTEGEQKVRLAEAFNSAIGAAMEFMEEGDNAKEVVKEFLAGALATPGGRKLTEVAVRSRMDEAGVFQAATPEERKKKLEEVGLWGLLTLLLELGMSFTDNAVGAVVSEVQSATGAGR